MSAILREQKRQDMISAAFPYQKHRRRVLGSEMAYMEVGVLLHERGLMPADVRVEHTRVTTDSHPGLKVLSLLPRITQETPS